jgi:SulP family sulfate permease
MLATVATVVYTHNLAIGVLVGVLLSGIFFAGKIAQLFRVTTDISADGRVRTYRVEGQLFYASVEDFMDAFDFREAPERVVIDVSEAHIWDISSVAGAGHGDPEIPPRRGGGRGRGHEPGDRNAGRPAGGT